MVKYTLAFLLLTSRRLKTREVAHPTTNSLYSAAVKFLLRLLLLNRKAQFVVLSLSWRLLMLKNWRISSHSMTSLFSMLSML